MILNGSQRGNSKNLALHLLKEENELVEVHEIRGFVSDDLFGAFQESYAISRATKCKQHLYSLSLNPPKDASPSIEEFEKAIHQAEKRLGLDNQPRIIVFHEKHGVDGKLRRHAHAVWCRIDIEKMRAVQLSFTNKKLREVSRELFVEHNWRMPDGLKDSKNRDPRNFTLAEWQQAKRAGKNAKELKAMFQDCWTLSDSKTALKNILFEQGFVLAQGKRGHVAVDYQGEVYPISRWTGKKAKEIRARLGELDGLPSVEKAQVIAAKIITNRLEVLKAQEQEAAQTKKDKGRVETHRFKKQQKHIEGNLRKDQERRQTQEESERLARIRTGVLGFMDRFTGRRKRTIEDNLEEATAMQGRDLFEIEVMENNHHHNLQQHFNKLEATQIQHLKIEQELDTDIAWLTSPEELHDDSKDRRQNEEERRKSNLRNNRSRDGPSLG